MNILRTTTITALVLAGSLGVASTASAASDETFACEHADELEAQATELLGWIDGRQAAITEWRAEAETAGANRFVAHFDRVLQRLDAWETQLTTRVERFSSWADAHCD